ncbi:MAG: hypothetical protein SF187_24625 [Deltaproteobacteria bacterium]|nr:hypothetical protein [Deltaproteobacteria bacterium]
MAKKLLAKYFVAGALVAGLAAGCDDDEPEVVTDAAATDGGGGSNADGGVVPGTDSGSDVASPACPAETAVTGDITANTTWACPSYSLKKLIYVTNGATLTIKEGVKITADTTVSNPVPGLIVSRGSKLMAKGTAAKPILFTSENPVGARAAGNIAGLALLGSATINQGTCSTGGAAGCAAPGFLQNNFEGINGEPRAIYGGTDDASSCGELEYVRIEFAGAELQPGKELNGLSVAGCGSGTKLSYIQVHRGKDDGVEFFGGTASIDHVVITGEEDDALDWDLGWRGRAQFVVIQKWVGFGDNGFESNNATDFGETLAPRSAPQLYNVTLVGTPTTRAMLLRQGTRGIMKNFIVQGFGKNVDVQWKDAANVPTTEWPAQLSVENSVFFGNVDWAPETSADAMAADYNDDFGFDEKAAFSDAARKNQFAVDPQLTAVVETAPNFTPKNPALANQAVPPAGFDATANYAGAIAPNAATSWLDGWTAFPKN